MYKYLFDTKGHSKMKIQLRQAVNAYTYMQIRAHTFQMIGDTLGDTSEKKN